MSAFPLCLRAAAGPCGAEGRACEAQFAQRLVAFQGAVQRVPRQCRVELEGTGSLGDGSYKCCSARHWNVRLVTGARVLSVETSTARGGTQGPAGEPAARYPAGSWWLPLWVSLVC